MLSLTLSTLSALALVWALRRYRRHARGHPAAGFDLPEMKEAVRAYLRERDERRRAA